MCYDVVGLEFLKRIVLLRKMAFDAVFIRILLCVYFLLLMTREVGADGDTYTPADLL